ncbi:MAG: phosphotransferase [Spiroplasma poulsonii]|uniref:Phosphotransferase enzyme family n=1 Tax=Spiroplasma poulsonii TaxID=2138 RepID=A0A2P6FE46_9MOLU|nr:MULTISPECIES: phosphotransferase [Spiroplasma]KAF0850725.1 Phosphotransferase enzyme family [Spiroplasma poulsonii]MBH8622751.1 trifolitoxin immunity protein [Spiroplasma sp. hyd1]MBW1241989.1 phosphotransferase [Spiroplasma poulsonii]PQM31735.1 Phosphotransferase enzyme family [Spiroplasma poulsonii]PWF96766.1 Phosphotransferase enzyme family protein [Spiroplasma poulsonii]
MSQNLTNFSKSFKYNRLSNQIIIINHNTVFKFVKLSPKRKNIINWLLANNSYYLPNINIFQNYISYDLIAGYSFKQIGFTGILELKNILLVIQTLQKLKYKRKYVVHGDLSPVNIIFTQNLEVKKIIDWDNAKLGSKYQDPAYIFWLWINFGANNKNFSQLKREANVFKNTLQYNQNDLKKLQWWIYKVIKNKMKKHSYQIKNNDWLLKWYLNCIE